MPIFNHTTLVWIFFLSHHTALFKLKDKKQLFYLTEYKIYGFYVYIFNAKFPQKYRHNDYC